jgi:endonuclease YncB( thermonuclease family)
MSARPASASRGPLVVLHLVFVLLLAVAATAFESFSGRCVGVLDGDSLKVLDGGHTFEVRLEGIDAPEKGQAFGDRAKQTLSDLVYGKDVRVAGKTTDSYGRLVARVFVELPAAAPLDVNLEMVRRGMAWHYTRYSSERALADAEATARARRTGLWADPHAVAPWTFRHGPESRPAARGGGAARSPASPASPSAAASGASAALGEVVANTSSHLYHTMSCPNAHCQHCMARFASAAAAEAAGYRPAGCCHHGS